MKSIKEKAIEVQAGYDDVQAPAIGRGFVLGANYVLEVVETILEDKELDVEETYDKIYAMIKQLKK